MEPAEVTLPAELETRTETLAREEVVSLEEVLEPRQVRLQKQNTKRDPLFARYRALMERPLLTLITTSTSMTTDDFRCTSAFLGWYNQSNQYHVQARPVRLELEVDGRPLCASNFVL